MKVVTFSATAPVGLDLETHDTLKTIVVKGAHPGGAAANVGVESSRAFSGAARRNATQDNARASRAQAGVGKDWTIVKLNTMKIPKGLDIDEFAKQVRSRARRAESRSRARITSRLCPRRSDPSKEKGRTSRCRSNPPFEKGRTSRGRRVHFSLGDVYSGTHTTGTSERSPGLSSC